MPLHLSEVGINGIQVFINQLIVLELSELAFEIDLVVFSIVLLVDDILIVVILWLELPGWLCLRVLARLSSSILLSRWLLGTLVELFEDRDKSNLAGVAIYLKPVLRGRL